MLHEFTHQQDLIVALSDAVGSLLVQAIEQSGRASLAVSGGSTPKPLFERLSHLNIPWDHVVLTLVDERWVNVESEDSNEHLVRTHFLKNRATKAIFIGMKNAAPSAAAGKQECEHLLQHVPRPFDLVILGMGNDGHTASLFPGARQLSAATDPDSGRMCMAVTPPTSSHDRMTLTLPAILTAKQIFLHIIGAGKRKTLEQALSGGPPEAMPIRFVLGQQQVPVTIYHAP